MNFLKIVDEKVFCNESLSNLENVLKRNLRTDRAKVCIFRASGGTNFENLLVQRFLKFSLQNFPQKTLDTSDYFH